MRSAWFFALVGATMSIIAPGGASAQEDLPPVAPAGEAPTTNPPPANPPPADLGPLEAPAREAPPEETPPGERPAQTTAGKAPRAAGTTAAGATTGPKPTATAPPKPTATSTAVLHRVLIFVRQDVAWVAGEDPCTLESQSSGEFSCFRNTGTQYLGTPDPSRAIAFEGFEVATTRILGGYERFFGSQIALTGLAGVVLRGGGPTPVGRDAHAFMPVHLELDVAFWPWRAAERAGQLRPFVVVGGGLAQIDSSFALTVHEDPDAPPAASQLDNPDQQELEVYAKRGTGFLDAGLGGEVRISGPLTARARALGLWSFPRSGGHLAFDLGIGVDL